MSYRALELKDGRVALLPGDVPIVFARLEEEFLPADPTTNGNARIPGKVKERAPRKAKRTGRMTMSDKLPVVAPPPRDAAEGATTTPRGTRGPRSLRPGPGRSRSRPSTRTGGPSRCGSSWSRKSTT